jgi:phosphohistidine phosphatase SixA
MFRGRSINGWAPIVVVLLAVCFVACQRKAPGPPSATGPLPPSTFADEAALIKALRAGGYVIAVRHAHTDMGQKDYIEFDFDDCAKQRNLDEQGRTDAKAVGEAVKALRIPISTVYSSPYCRTKETAELIFGSYKLNNACKGEDEKSLAARARLLGTRPPEGQNVVVVTHRNSMDKSTNYQVNDFEEGGGLVIVPKGGSEFAVVHTIKFTDWARLAELARTLE